MAWFLVLLTFLLAAIKSSDKVYQKVAVILPAFNEAENVDAVIDVIKKVKSKNIQITENNTPPG